MKKATITLIFLLTAALILSFAACTVNTDTPDTSDTSSQTVTETAGETDTENAAQTDTGSETNAETESTGTEIPRSEPGYPKDYTLSKAPWDDLYIKSLSFFGDSTTYHLKARGGIAADKVIHGKAYTVSLAYLSDLRIRTASETDDDYKKVSDYFLTHHPERLVVTVGLGGGVTFVQNGKLSKEDFMSLYKKLIRYIREASPETTVMLQSIFPVLETNYIGASNDMIVEINSWIREYADENGLYYFDTHSVLTDENGALKSEYAVKKDGSGNVDGYHITVEGYTAILNYLIAYKYEG